jgi:hypothetical protein
MLQRSAFCAMVMHNPRDKNRQSLAALGGFWPLLAVLSFGLCARLTRLCRSRLDRFGWLEGHFDGVLKKHP